MSVMEAILMLDNLVDESDPDVSTIESWHRIIITWSRELGVSPLPCGGN